jgi:sarcosine oxidase/L-pipecolate oxidase
VLVANEGEQGEKYVRESFENVKILMAQAGDEGAIQELPSKECIEAEVGTGGGSGTWGYVNHRSGWADAEASMIWLRKQVEATGRVTFVQDQATSLEYAGSKATGAHLKSGKTLRADLTILATGAWSGSLIDLRGRVEATGQVLCYLPLTPSEQERMGKIPVLLNMSTGLFMIPPRNNTLKVARHAYGYSNPTTIPHPHPHPHPNPTSSPTSENPEEIVASLPRTTWDDPEMPVPAEGERACRQAVREMLPSLADRPFVQRRICWYSDTPAGDFLIDYHPSYSNLFLATGGSGHGFKFLPVIGDRILDLVEGRGDQELQRLWAWRPEKVDSVVTEDGSRGGRPGMMLDVEMAKGSKL